MAESDELPKSILKWAGEEASISGYDACFLYKGAKWALAFRPSTLTHGNISHEISHAVFHILSFFGWKADVDNDEPMSYLSGWLTEWVYAQLAKKKLEVKPGAA